MKIVTVCDQGNNRSVHFAQLLKEKYRAEVIPVGFLNASRSTRKMLFEWADIIICTVGKRSHWIPEEYKVKVRVWDVGPDIYTRPFNQTLFEIATKFIKENPL